jgi:hypothetical protein
MGDRISEHEAMTKVIQQIREERDVLKNLINDALYQELLQERRKVSACEARIVELQGQLAQAMSGVKPSDYSA